jgi:hypothetical protein
METAVRFQSPDPLLFKIAAGFFAEIRRMPLSNIPFAWFVFRPQVCHFGMPK